MNMRMNLDYSFFAFLVFLCTVYTITPVFAEESSESQIYPLDYVGEMMAYKSTGKDDFPGIARMYEVGYVELRAANQGVDPWLPGEGTPIRIPSMYILPDAKKEGIVINLPEMKLYYFPEDGSEPLVYSVGIGRDGLDTPIGVTSIVRKQVAPSWRPTRRMREEDPELPALVEPGPENPLGTHAMYLGWASYAIHGTNKPFGIGRRVSSGCIRMYPESIIDIYERINKGTKVTVVDQAIKIGWIDDELFLEAHPEISQVNDMEIYGRVSDYRFDEYALRLLIKAKKAKSSEGQDVIIDWQTVRHAVKERNGYPVRIGAVID